MSGIASAASTTPGSVATSCSCSSERSLAIASSSSASANTRAGTRMSGRASAGISHRNSSICLSSDIEHHPSLPASVGSLEAEPVIGDSLDEVGRMTLPALHRRPQPVLAELEPPESLEHQTAALAQEGEPREPVGEQRRPVLAGQLHGDVEPLRLLLARKQLAHRLKARLEQAAFAGRLELHLKLAGVLYPAIRHIQVLPGHGPGRHQVWASHARATSSSHPPRSRATLSSPFGNKVARVNGRRRWPRSRPGRSEPRSPVVGGASSGSEL